MIYSVHQPHYLPYIGYLIKVALSDEFVFLEDVQYTRREFQNRNKVKGPDGTKWLTIPVSGDYKSTISEISFSDNLWQKKHYETLKRFYKNAPFCSELEGFYEIISEKHDKLAQLTINTTSFFLDSFGIYTPRHLQGNYAPLSDEPNRRIIEIGKKLGADTYLAGIGGKNYMDLDLFNREGIKVVFLEVPDIKYSQLHSDFVPFLGGIDLLLNEGGEAFMNIVMPKIEEMRSSWK